MTNNLVNIIDNPKLTKYLTYQDDGWRDTIFSMCYFSHKKCTDSVQSQQRFLMEPDN